MKFSKHINIQVLLVISLLLLIGIYLSSLNLNNSQIYSIKTPTGTSNSVTPVFSVGADEIFRNVVAKNVNLNSGITIYKISTSIDLQDTTQSQNDFGFYIYNHANESILFSNLGFGLKAYSYNEASKTWYSIKLSISPDRRPIILPPHLEKVDAKINNTWSTLGWGIEPVVEYQKVRFYVTGTGVTTSNIYSAYLDVMVVP